MDTIGGEARVRHLLSHTSSGTPGTVFRYDGNTYGRLTAVVEKVTGRSFSAGLTDRIIRRLGLKRTGPNPRRIPDLPPGFTLDRTFEQSGLRLPSNRRPLALGYRRSRLTGSMNPMPHPTYLFAAAGLVASAPDVADGLSGSAQAVLDVRRSDCQQISRSRYFADQDQVREVLLRALRTLEP